MSQAADFFVSYTSADRAWAEWIAWQLEAEGYQVDAQPSVIGLGGGPSPAARAQPGKLGCLLVGSGSPPTRSPSWSGWA